MIGKEEINQKAKEFEISPTSVEKDYVFGWILFGLFTASNLKDIIFLKGGNALRKGYFENTRFSSDLDLGIPNDINENILLEEINNICDFIGKNAGVNFITSDNKIEEKFSEGKEPIPDLKVYEVKIYFKDFYSNSDHIRLKIAMDITRFDKVLLPIQFVKLIHPYSDASKVSCTIRCMKLEEIIATKLKCILQRQHAPDLFDYVYSIKLLGGDLDKNEVVRAFIRKTIYERNPHVLKDILNKTSFDYFKSYWHKTIVCAKTVMFHVEDAINVFLNDLDQLFSIYRDNGFRNFSFFGPELRGPIIEAGRKQVLLKAVYNGHERMIEPYSLKYLMKKDGVQREYFYAYNRSGGNSPPGPRSFVVDGFSSMIVTEETFEPRFQIELSKAGERPENPYLFDPNKPQKAPARQRSLWSKPPKKNVLKYIYKCASCGKKFTKTKMDSSLNPHKNKSKYKCGGRFGIYQGTKYT